MPKIIFPVIIILTSVNFCLSQNGWSTINKTTDYHYSTVYFINEDTGFITGFEAKSQNGIILHTADGTVSWDATTYNDPVLSIFFINKENGFIGGSNFIGSTKDGGVTWTRNKARISGMINSIYFANNMTGFAVGGNEKGDAGIIYKTTDGGDSWANVTPENINGLHSVCMTDENRCYVSGLNGQIFRTSDAGKIWDKSYEMKGYSITNIRSVSKDKLYASGGNEMGNIGIIAFTLDGGNDWSYIKTINALSSVQFINEDIAYACGIYGTILKSTDGGTNWNKQKTPTTNNLSSIQFVNSSTGYAVGWNGTILKTTTGGD